MLDDLQLQRDLDLINEDEYYSQLEVLRNKYLEKGSKDWWQYTKEIIDYEKNSLNSLKDLNEEITNDYKNHLKERETLTSEFYSKISANKLYDNPSLIFEGEKKSWYELNDWTDELKTLDEFENKILSVQERLKNVFAGDDEILQSVLDTIRNDAFSDESSILLNVMNNTDDASLRKWAEGYKQYIEKSKRITKNVYEDELKTLDNNFLQKISEKFANSSLFEQLKGIGENVTESLMDGIESKSDWLKEQILNFCNSISQTFGDAFSVGGIDNVQLAGTTGINSIRNYQIDYTIQLNNINDSIDRFISLVGEYLPGISQKMDRPIVVDGNSLAVGMARKMDSQLGKLTVAKGRGNV